MNLRFFVSIYPKSAFVSIIRIAIFLAPLYNTHVIINKLVTVQL